MLMVQKDITTWAIGVDGILVLKSPYMNNTDCLKE